MPQSQAQVKLAGAVISGKSHAMPRSIAEEILNKMRGHKMSELPKRKGSKLKDMMARRTKKRMMRA